MEQKRCRKCRQIKPISEFWRDQHKKSGRKDACRSCLSRSNRRAANAAMYASATGIPLATLAGLADGTLAAVPKRELLNIISRLEGLPVKHPQQSHDLHAITEAAQEANSE